MRFLRRSLVGLFLLSVTVALLAVAGRTGWSALQARWSDEPAARRGAERVFAVNVQRIEPGTVQPILEVFGEVRSRRTLEIRATAAGRVVWLSDAFEEGGTVGAGDLLVRIDPANAQTALDVAKASLGEAEVELADAERAIGLAQDDLKAAEEQAVLREQALARQKDARSRGVVSDTAVEDAELTAASARQSVLSRRQALAQAESRIEKARAALARQKLAVAEAGRAVEDTEIRADFAGSLSGVTLVAGRLVANNERLAELVDPQSLEVSFRLSAAEYARFLDANGALMPLTVTVSLDVEGIDLTSTGQIVREGAAVGEGQTGRLIFAVLDEARGLRPGDFVSVRIEETPLENVALLPATAVAADQTVLAVGTEDRLERLPVQVLRRQGDDVILSAETVAGHDVVSEQTPLLGAGIRVRVMRPEGQVQQASAEPETVELSAERRAKLVAFVEGSRMPDEAKQRVLSQLQAERVPAQVVARLESRMGG